MSGIDLPRFTGWSIPDDAMALLQCLVLEREPLRVLECGSGRSTPQVASWLEGLGHGGRMVSLDHLLEFAGRTADYVEDNGLAEICDVRCAPLVPHGQPGCLSPAWYERGAWCDLSGIDMLLVDGPPGHASEGCARDPAVPLLLDRLTAHALIVLDDTNRPDERATLDHWQELLGCTWQHSRHSTGQISWTVRP